MFEKNIVWIDIETTGLYGRNDNIGYGERDHSILEVGLIITDSTLNILHSSSYVIDHDYDEVCGKMVEFVHDMHDKSGLLDDLKTKSSVDSLYSVETQIIEDIDVHCGEEKPLLGGSSIHFDRFFISSQMKRLNDRLHYRNFDASTVKMLYEMTSNDSIDIESDGVSHRALDDITYSLTLTKYIVEYFEKRGSIIDKLFEVVS